MNAILNKTVSDNEQVVLFEIQQIQKYHQGDELISIVC